MDSVDQVQTSITQVPTVSSLGLCDLNFTQINCQRNINADSFTQGVMDFQWNISGQQRWSPSRSFFRARLHIESADGLGTRPSYEDDITIAEDVMNQLFSNIYCYIGNVNVSSLTQFVGQASMIKARLGSTYSYLQSIGKGAFFLDPDFQSRQRKTSVDGVTQSLSNNTVTSTLDKTQLGFEVTDYVTLSNTGLFLEFHEDAGGGNPIDVTPILLDGDFININGLTWQISDVDEFVVGRVYIKPAPTSRTEGFFRTTTNFDLVDWDLDWCITRTVIAYNPLDGHGNIEVCFKPPVGLFSTDSAIPAGSFRISMFPKSNLSAGLESNLTDEQGNWELRVDSMYFYAAIFKDPQPFNDGAYYLNMDEMNIQTKKLSQGASQNSFNFTLPSSTLGIALFSQSNDAGVNTLVPTSRFLSEDKSNLGLNHIQVTYGNVSKPLTDYDSSFTNSTNYITQRWLDTQIHSELYSLSCETLEDYLVRGVMTYFSFLRSAENRSTEAQVTITYDNLTGDNNIFIASVYRTLCKIQIQSGFVTEVQTLNL